MTIATLYPTHPEQLPTLDTAALRRHHLISGLFKEGTVQLTLSHVERMVIGGVLPVAGDVVMEIADPAYSAISLERREFGIVNIGGEGSVSVDGTPFALRARDGLYVGMGVKSLRFASNAGDQPAKFYLVSTPAHASHPTTLITVEMAMPKKMGASETSNARTIFQYVNPALCKSSQLLLGLTALEPGSVWNTMPCHRHGRRSEAYFYFDMAPDSRVFHMMGEPSETRHIVVANEEAVVSPPWSLHSGVGTARYAFIWAMGGENQDYTDMAHIATSELR
jgi:4-deoxy-L-threo-5-hexosulose-uronate ketol-isomerase